MPELTGLLNVRKPRGWTSHDVVARVRRLSGQRRVGHAGTLDPLAEGVLPVLLGRATRLADVVGEGPKRYAAEVRLGSATDTDDAEGTEIARAPVPPLDRTAIEQVLPRFRGTIQQVPPAYSAVKVAGRRAYAVARGGGHVALPPRTVTVYELRLAGLEGDLLRLEVGCSRGTYVRSLARDLARALGTYGHLTALVRTQVGPFHIEEALTLEQVAERGVPACLQPPERVLLNAPSYHANATELDHLAHGRAVPLQGLQAEQVRVYDPAGRLVAVGIADGAWLRPRIWLEAPEALVAAAG